MANNATAEQQHEDETQKTFRSIVSEDVDFSPQALGVDECGDQKKP